MRLAVGWPLDKGENMTNAADIVGYTFRADIFCPRCIIDQLPTGEGEAFDGWKLAEGAAPMSTEDNLDEIAAAFVINRMDERTYDSGDFPKVIFASMIERDERCGVCGESLVEGYDDCECSEEYGPCELHTDVLAQREGASTRTADDLAYVFLTDVVGILEAEGRPVPAQLAEAVAYWTEDDLWDDNMGCRWVKETVEAEIHDDINTGESALYDIGASVWWDDGYVIARITGGPLSD